MRQEEKAEEILTSLNKKRASLFAFFSAMPKGGDLHHHYSGSVYAETFVEYVIKKDFYVNVKTLQVIESIDSVPKSSKLEWRRFSALEHENLEELKMDLIRKWSVKDFSQNSNSHADHFFGTFSDFAIADKPTIEKGLSELRARAIQQKLSYLETMFYRPNLDSIQLSDETELDKILLQFQDEKDEIGLSGFMERLHQRLQPMVDQITDSFNQEIREIHEKVVPDSNELVVRYQNFCLRFKQPTDMFIELMCCFHSASKSNLLVGANIVSPEHGETSMRDYWLHMRYYRFFKSKYQNVKFSIHAGELTLGLVRPELLGIHLRETVEVAQPQRIGHAVDIIYDTDIAGTLEKIKLSDTAIEINLSSNEFILDVSDDLHPVEIYINYDIPIVICTDDEGVLRSSLTAQYVLLAQRHNFSYSQIKKMVYNSIKYSFLDDDLLKNSLLLKLDADFNEFEKKIPNLLSFLN